MPPLRSTFPGDLSAEFKKLCPPGVPGEVALFRSLQKAFDRVGKKYEVEEYHGARSQVQFMPSRMWRPGAGRCELSDLLILTYQRTPVIDARFTFLQCKRDIGAAPHSLVGGASTHGNYEQWDLLHNRPNITPIGSVRPPMNVLSSATLESVGSFGIFTRAAPGWDMTYLAADQLTPRLSRAVRKGPLQIAGGPPTRSVAGFNEAVHAFSVLDFGVALENVTVGTPLFTAPSATQAWLAAALQQVGAHASGVSRAAELGREILRRLGNVEVSDSLAGDAPNMVVLTVENGSVARRAETIV